MASLALGEDMPVRALTQYLSSSALGETLPVGSTVYVRYRRGGGANSNVAAGMLTSFTAAEILFPPTNGSFSNAVADAVRKSLRVTNPLPALGGRDEPTIEEVRFLSLLGEGNCAVNQHSPMSVPGFHLAAHL